MSRIVLAKLPIDQVLHVKRLSIATGVPIYEVAGVLIAYMLDDGDVERLERLVKEYLPLYRNQLTIRWTTNTLRENMRLDQKEVTSDEPTVTEDP